jgi:hypothetical protein
MGRVATLSFQTLGSGGVDAVVRRHWRAVVLLPDPTQQDVGKHVPLVGLRSERNLENQENKRKKG